jgi:hypothetical protein
MTAIQQLAFPMRVVNGQLATVDQGGVDDAVGQVHLLCLTPQGWMTGWKTLLGDNAADVGLYPQQHLAGGPDVQEIRRQIDLYVPDAEAVVEEDPSALDEALGIVGVRVTRSA